MMSIHTTCKTLCIALLIAGIAIVSKVSARSTTPWTYVASPEHADLAKVGDTLDIDVGGLQVHLDALRFDERPEQIADWAVLGALSAAKLDADTLRAALFDKPQIRFPEFDEVYTFDYGRGRRVLLPDQQVWLFYSDTDPAPRATLAHLADNVRMETQELPQVFRVFRYRSDLASGVIQVTREADMKRERMFSAEYGYHEALVSSETELKEWLGHVDDITYIRSDDGGKLTLGGRRIEEHRTANLTLEDIAALYQAHAKLKERRDKIDEDIRNKAKIIIEPFDALIDLYNAQVQQLNSRHYSTNRSQWDNAYKFIATAHKLRQVLEQQGVSGLPPVDGSLANLQRAEAFINAAKPLVQRAYEKRGMEVSQDMAIRGVLPPEAPGFSLDPQWNVPNLIADLELLRDDPGRLIAAALQLVPKKSSYDESATPILAWAAGDVASMFPQGTRFRVPSTWRDQLDTIILSVRGRSGVEAEKGALVGYYTLRDDLNHASGRKLTEIVEAKRVDALLGFIEARNLMQCARYDGPLKGTVVGMNLFYTDLLAKLWAGVDYYRSSPVDQVYGYLSLPRFNPNLGPAFWDEEQKLPATRLWFGPRQEGYSTTTDQAEIYFAHVATHVYSAGSNPLDPGEESIANESSRRVFGWWNRHFERVADFEPQYYVQNQIMKWSILTGWLLEKNRAEFLANVSVTNDLRFDHWIKNDNLTFKHPVPFFPEKQWIGKTECMEILRSYYFPSADGVGFIQGGVSLGSRGTLSKGSLVNRAQNYSLRHAGVDYAQSTKNSVHTLRGSSVEFTRSSGGASRAKIRPAKNVRMRGDSRFDAKLGDIRVDFVGGQGEFRFVTQSDAGGVGSLTARHTSGRIKLIWKDNAVAQDKGVVSRLSELASSNKISAEKIALDPEFSPTSGLYVIEPAHGNPYILRVPMAPYKTFDVGAAEKARIYEVGSKLGDNSPLNSDNVVLTSAGHHERLRIGVDNKGNLQLHEQSKPHKVHATVTSRKQAQALLSATRWQRVKVNDEHADAITRVFSARGPPAGSRPITIKSGASGESQMHGLVAEDTLYLDRSISASDQQAFNDFVTTLHLDGSGVQKIIEAAARGESSYTLPAWRMPEMSPAPVQRALEGDYRPLLTELRSAAKRGKLDQALQDVHELSHQQTVSNLRNGRTISGARRYLASDYEHNSVDADMARTLANLNDRVLDRAVREVQAMAQWDGLSAAQARRFADEIEAAGSGVAADYLRVHKGLLPDVSPDIAPHLSLEASRYRMREILDVDGWKGKDAPWAELADANKAELVDELRSAGARIYLKWDAYLHRLPWDEAPGPTLAKVAADTRYEWMILEDLSLNATRAHDIRANGIKHVGIEIPAEQANPQRRAASNRLIRIRARRASNDNRCNQNKNPCDLDCDGQVSSSEQQQCALR